MASVSVPDVIERAVAATASLFEAKKLNLIRSIEPDLPAITGDQDRLIQVVESNGSELVSRAVLSKPDIIILNSLLSSDEAVRALRFEKGMEKVLLLIYQ